MLILGKQTALLRWTCISTAALNLSVITKFGTFNERTLLNRLLSASSLFEFVRLLEYNRSLNKAQGNEREKGTWLCRTCKGTWLCHTGQWISARIEQKFSRYRLGELFCCFIWKERTHLLWSPRLSKTLLILMPCAIWQCKMFVVSVYFYRILIDRFFFSSCNSTCFVS